MKGSSGHNPYELPPAPLPFQDEDTLGPMIAWDLFTPDNMKSCLEENRDWLQYRPRTVRQVQKAIFPAFVRMEMTDKEIYQVISWGLWDKGYKPSDDGPNPIWTFPV